MNKFNYNFFLTLLISFVFMFHGCQGSESTSDEEKVENTAPSFISLSTINVDENQLSVMRLEAKDIDLNIGDVCYSTGFMSKSHFTRSFRKQFGMLPSQISTN